MMHRSADPNVSIMVDDHVVEVGSFFGVTVERSPTDGESNSDDGLGQIRSIRVELRWYSEGRGDEDGEVVGSVEIPVNEFGVASGRVELPVPAVAPISYDGTLMRIRWAISARTDIKLGIDQLSSIEVLVVPRGGHGSYEHPHPLRLR